MRLPLPAALLLALLVASGAAAAADDVWRPFDETPQRRPARTPPPAAQERPPLAPMEGLPGRGVRPGVERAEADPRLGPAGSDGGLRASPPGSYRDAPPPDEKARGVERSDLAPVIAGDGSALPVDLWQGLDAPRLVELVAALDLPPRSQALHGLWRRLLLAESAPAGSTPVQHAAVRSEALYRSGLLEDLANVAGKAATDSQEPTLRALGARSEIGLGRLEGGCATVRALMPGQAGLPPRLRGDILVLSGLCGLAAGNPGAAGLAAELAREAGAGESFAVQALDALSVGAKPPTLPARLSPIDYRLLVLAKAVDPKAAIDRADAPLLAAMALDETAEPRLRLAAAEGAARLNAIAPPALATIYRALPFPPADLADPLARPGDPLLRRALLFRAAEAERTPLKKVRNIRALLDDARRSGLYMPALQMLAPVAQDVVKAPEIGWFAETAVEIMLAAGRLGEARAWLAFAGSGDRPEGEAGPLQHWLALVDIADPALGGRRGEGLAVVEQLAVRGRFQPETLHRLATVLDALDYQVPMRLWEAASRTPQPSGGHLPETGVLSTLQAAAKRKEFGRTVLLVARTLGPAGAEGAHIIALGDSIRALKRAGLEPDARRLALEAVFAGWPRAASN
jgi:hypothetical protein